MKIDVPERFAAPLPRKDILAICVYLNRSHGTKAVDACVNGPGVFLDRVADAARMQ
jgi:hypothetical protein